MFRKIVVLGLLLVLALYAGSEVAVNNYAEKAIARKLQQDHPEAREVKASVSLPVLFPFLSSGRIRRVGATAQNVAVAVPLGLPALTAESTILAADVTVALEGLDVDRDALLQRRRLLVESIDHLEMTVEITEEEASKALRLIPGFEALAFEFLDDVSRITGAGVIGGTFVVEEGTRLHFVPNAVGGLPVGLDPVIQLGNLPFFRCTADVEVKIVEGRMRVTCSQDNPPVNG
ncbi:MAG: hypothetical protein ACRDKW_16760 [Actinomycetota bacterium]